MSMSMSTRTKNALHVLINTANLGQDIDAMQSAALRYAAERMRDTGEAGTVAAHLLLSQLADDDHP